MPVLIHTDPQSAKSLRDFPLRLLVEGSAPKPPLNTEFHSVAARSANAVDQDQLTAGHRLFCSSVFFGETECCSTILQEQNTGRWIKLSCSFQNRVLNAGKLTKKKRRTQRF